MDTDGDGTISQDELMCAVVAASKQYGDSMSEAEAEALTKRMMLAADIDGNGSIDFDEYQAIVVKVATKDVDS
jgi:Ca2+-binding EF-hand superfamily protein